MEIGREIAETKALFLNRAAMLKARLGWRLDRCNPSAGSEQLIGRCR